MSFCVFCFYQMPGVFSMKKKMLPKIVHKCFRFCFLFFSYVWRSSGLWNFPKTLQSHFLTLVLVVSPHLWFECTMCFSYYFPKYKPVSKHTDCLLCPVRVYGLDARARREGKVLPQTGREKSALIPARLRCDLLLYYFTQTYSESCGWCVWSGFRRD